MAVDLKGDHHGDRCLPSGDHHGEGVCFLGITGGGGITMGRGFALWGSAWDWGVCGVDHHEKGGLLCWDHWGGLVLRSPLVGGFALWGSP